MSHHVELANLTKSFPSPKGPAVVVRDFNLNLRKGEFVTLIGHSGCGKSTVLSMLAGLSPVTSGGIISTGGANTLSVPRVALGAEGMIGAAAGYALSKELAPVIGSFLVTARSGSSMAAEIATMRVNEQIDAMRVMAVNPYNYLVAPRIWASVVMMPLLTIIFIASGVFCSFIIGVVIYNVDLAVFFDKIQWIVKPRHIWEGWKKAMIFGLIFSSLGCYKGFFARGGAKGVGRATTEAVVLSLVTILIVDFFISYLTHIMAQDSFL